MKHHFHKMAKFTTLILASSLPYSLEVLAETEKNQNAVKSLSTKHKVLKENSQQIVKDTGEFLSDTQQALMALEKTADKAALEVLQEVSKNLADILENNITMASVIAEMEADIFNFEENSDTVKKEPKQIDELLYDETLQSAFLSIPFYKRLKLQRL
jgi:hypothetical protein